MKRILCAGLVFLCFAAVAQLPQDRGDHRFIEVTGTNEMEVTPDEIYLLITLQESKERPNIQKQEEELKQSLKDLGIDLANLTLNAANADYGRVRLMKKEVQVSKSYQLKLANAEMLGRLYEKLDRINVQDAYVWRVDHSKMTEIKKESRIKALKTAKDKVDYLLAAVGQQAGQPLQITEVEMYEPMYANTMMSLKNSVAAERAGGEQDEISFKKIKIKTSFMVKYEIANK